MSAHEPDLATVVADIELNVRTVIRALELADIASAAFQIGEYDRAFEALTDYHALRNEMSETPFRI